VRVDVQHRAVNQNPSPSKRVHLLMGVKTPPIGALAEPFVIPGASRPVQMMAAPAAARAPAPASQD
jgi:hypothetical protein